LLSKQKNIIIEIRHSKFYYMCIYIVVGVGFQ
jgi:hypothetical protein